MFTPWLLDILPESLPDTLARINNLLTMHGTWINQGSIAFNYGNYATQYSFREFKEIVESSGFKWISHTDTFIPYLSSPIDRNQRVEKVLTFVAEKVFDVPEPDPFKHLPSWFYQTKEPIEKLKAFSQTQISHAITANILALIDGKKSISELSKTVSSNFKLSEDESIEITKNILRIVYEKSRFIY